MGLRGWGLVVKLVAEIEGWAVPCGYRERSGPLLTETGWCLVLLGVAVVVLQVPANGALG